MTRLRVCTVVARNYLAQARTLAESLQRWNPDLRLTVLLVDALDPPPGAGSDAVSPTEEQFDVLRAVELPNVGFFEHLAFKYNVLELSTALKPFVLAHVLDTDPTADAVVHLDPDVLVCRPLDDIGELLARHEVLLTPHLLEPLPDEVLPNESDILLSGTYNLGFIGVARGEVGRRLLAWWQRRVYDHGAANVAAGQFTDQRWIDLVPGLFGGVHILRDPAYNVAYWNLHERGAALHVAAETVCDGRGPISFLHYSGYSPDRPDVVSSYQRRWSFDDFPELRSVFGLVDAALARHRHAEQRHTPYALGTFANGQVIPELARRHLRDGGLERSARWGDLFATGPGTFWAHLRHAVDDDGHDSTAGPPRIWWLVWASRPDLQRIFPRPGTDDAANFRSWAIDHGGNEHPDVAALADPEMFAVTPHPPALPAIPAEARTAAMAGPAVAGAAAVSRATAAARRVLAAARRAAGGSERRRAGPAADPPPLAGPDGVNLVGHFSGEFGIGEVSRGFLAAVRAAGIPASLIDVRGGAHRHDDRRERGFQSGHDRPVNLFLVNTDGVGHYVAGVGAHVLEGRRNIGVWFWELPVVPDRLRPALELLDEVWVTSEFCAGAVRAAGHPQVVELPFPFLRPAPTRGVGRAQFALPPATPVLLTSFDAFSVVERKNPLGAVEAFRRALRCPDEAVLVVKASNLDPGAEQMSELRAACCGLDVRFVCGHLDRGTMSALIASCDAYVSLHRAEGFGLGMAEAMALAKPVVATGYSGNLAFMNDANSLLVPYRVVELARDHPPYEAGNLWADPDLDAAAGAIRWILDDPVGAAALGERAAADIAATLGPQRTAPIVAQRLAAAGAGGTQPTAE